MQRRDELSLSLNLIFLGWLSSQDRTDTATIHTRMRVRDLPPKNGGLVRWMDIHTCSQLYVWPQLFTILLLLLEGTARYAGLLLAPAEGFGRGFFCPSGKKRA